MISYCVRYDILFCQERQKPVHRFHVSKYMFCFFCFSDFLFQSVIKFPDWFKDVPHFICLTCHRFKNDLNTSERFSWVHFAKLWCYFQIDLKSFMFEAAVLYSVKIIGVTFSWDLFAMPGPYVVNDIGVF